MAEEKKSTDFWVKFISVGIFILSWVILIGMKYSNPDMSLKAPIIIAGILSVLSVISFFGNHLYKLVKTKSEEEIPEPIGEEKIMEIIDDELKKMWNHRKINSGIGNRRTATINKNIIYAYKINLIYPEKDFEDSIIIILNATYPHIAPTIEKSDLSEYHLKKRMNEKSLNPFDEDVIETELKVDDFGRPIQKTKETKQRKKEKKKEDEVV